MAKNMPSNTVPKAMVVKNESFGEGMAKPDTGTVPPTFRQAAEGDSHRISRRCEGNKDNDNENLSDTSDAAAENSQTIDIGHGEFDTYAIAYICKEKAIRMKKAVEETKNNTETFKANDSNMHTQARDPNPMYTQNMNPQPMDTENDVNPNPMYLQSSPGPTFKSNKSDDNPCTQTSADTHQQAFSRPEANNDDNHCLQPYAVARYQDDDEASSLKMPGDNEGHPCIQPDAVTHHEDDKIAIESGNCGVVQPYTVQYEEDETFGESANNDVNPCIQPYAVTQQEDQEPSLNCDDGQPYAGKYHQDDDSTSGSAASKNRHTSSIASEDEVIQPHAAAYMCQGDVGWNTTSGDTQASLDTQNQNQPTAASNSINDVSTSPSSNDVLHALDPNPMYAAADMVRGDVGWHTASEDTQASLSSQNLPAAASNSINDVSTSPSSNDVLHSLDPNPMYAAEDMCQGDVGWNTASLSSQNLPAAASNNINDANDVLHALNPNPMYVPNVQQPAAHGGDVKQKKITFGGMGKEPGKFLGIKGTAVSADNEIFVTDQSTKRVQVFSIKGAFLRLFPTVVPGESTRMRPYGVASDVESGYLWVLGKSSRSNGHVVQYSKNGQPIKKFDLSLKSFYPVIAMDVRNNKVIVGDKTTIMTFDPNGSRIWSSEVPTEEAIIGVTSDNEGNVLLTDWHKKVYKYNPSGVKIFEFGTRGDSLRGICLDTSGRVIVASLFNHRVDMFTSQGEFVHTIASIECPRDVAMGQCGDLVVTSSNTNTVTIFPRHMVLP
ncbi:PREDICTED: uncharacterized protein LOC109482338 [Branchiostoma belcheri]|uniref:Uncharacterized protein LOC109482338 n=1 Tax=Branchiostoma belcheri TaxID=7741 RepID=A0A6P4ZUM0_BRABE|nr:PREDICTED: uncharacterized protein LOC109482338 [Branchiostoma belcheri]